ncbi:DUF7199 family protein [Mycobacterium paragordonae]|uniref:DUF7199 family protein n=1 Tax=Mycobacterium paragordonae TaxID=1389713 RepID=UPI003F87C3EB
MNRGIAGLAVALGVLAGCNAPVADAATCEHRGPGHWEAHGGLEDDRYHLAHGQMVTCRGDNQPAEQRHDDSDEDRDRDHHFPGHREHKWWRND